MYDLLLRGGTIVDPSQGLHGIQDVAVEDGKIARIALSISSEEATRTVDVAGKIISPGLIDIHCHVYEGFTEMGINADLAGVRAGVTTVVDAGSSGCATFGGFPQHIVPKCDTEILNFLHICQTGLATFPDIIAESSINMDTTLKVADENKGTILGIKARMVSPALEILGMEMPRLAKKAAKESGIKLMVHVGDSTRRSDPNIVRQLLPILEPGDILTHYFTPQPGGMLDSNGKLVPEAKEAADRGVWLDTAAGMNCFSFDVGRRIVDQGLLPQCISTDLNIRAGRVIIHNLTSLMTRFMGMGFTLEQVVTMTTANSAKAIGQEHRLGSMVVGRQADISVLDVREGAWTVYDSPGPGPGEGIPVDKAIVPVLTVKRGKTFEPYWGPRPWGWEPDSE